jgi:hypothetical protein
MDYDAVADQSFGLIQLALAAPSDEDVRAFVTNPCAVARLIPLLPPVVTATLPSSRHIS